MKTIKHTNNLYQLRRLRYFNSFLVKEDDGYTVVDTNWPGSHQAIANTAIELDGDIKRIVLTHAHLDHAAGLDELVKLAPQAEVVMSARTARLLKGDITLDENEPQDKLRGRYVTQTTEPTRTVAEGDMVGSLRVVESPGHTPGHISLFDTRDGTLIAGDAYSTAMSTAVSGVMRWLFPFPSQATWHKPTALASARKLWKLEPSMLATGHGVVVKEAVAEMKNAINEAEKKFA
jgi:glyoxylase-like metal-dependent hydrolase (beta-lactamase superfamily II)